jgi:hypothetical protein
LAGSSALASNAARKLRGRRHVAERIGIHQARAAQWVRLAGSTYVDYVANRNAT